MKPLKFSSPATLGEALGLLAGQGSALGILGGGTDLIVQMRGGRRSVGHLVDVKMIPELRVLAHDGGGLRLGAAVTCAELAAFAPAREYYPALVDGVGLIGSTQIQNRATVGGNLCNASPAADSISPLIVLEAVLVAVGSGGTREIAAHEFITAPGVNALGEGELLMEIRLPPPPPRSGAAYLRFTPRNEMDIAVAGAAASLTLSEDGKSCTAARVAIGAAAPTPLLVEEAGRALVGSRLEAEALEAAARAASGASRPIDDMRGTAEYRKHLAGVLTRRAIIKAAARARGEAE